MDKSLVTLSILLSLVFLTSCNSQKKTKLEIRNCGTQEIDSIYIYNLFSKKHEKLNNIKIGQIINREYDYNTKNLPKEEKVVFALVTFKDDYYYVQENGLIGFPMAKVEDNYELFIYDYGITRTKDYIPPIKLEKFKISTFIQ